MAPQDSTKTLSERLVDAVEYRRRWRDNPAAQFESLAEQFYRETGLMAPGKSLPVEMVQDEMERKRAWDAFLVAVRESHDDACLQAAESLELFAKQILLTELTTGQPCQRCEDLEQQLARCDGYVADLEATLKDQR